MLNVTVLKMKDIKKYVIGMLVTTIVIIAISKYIPKILKEDLQQKLVVEKSMVECLDQIVPTISSINEKYEITEDEEEITEDKFLQGILKTQVSTIKGMEYIEEKEKIAKEEAEKNNQEIAENKENKIELAGTNLAT